MRRGSLFFVQLEVFVGLAHLTETNVFSNDDIFGIKTPIRIDSRSEHSRGLDAEGKKSSHDIIPLAVKFLIRTMLPFCVLNTELIIK